MKHYLRFSGRSGRIEFLSTWIGSWLASSLFAKLFLFVARLSVQNPKSLFWVTVMLMLGIPLTLLVFLMIWVFYAAVVRRMHDFGLSGWWLLLVMGLASWLAASGIFLPNLVLSFCGSVVLLFVPGHSGKNAFGERPPLFNGFMEVKMQEPEAGRDPNDKRIDFKL